MFTNRIQKVCESFLQNNVDALLVSNFFNILYLTGFKTLTENEREAFILVTKNNTYLFTDERYIDSNLEFRVQNLEFSYDDILKAIKQDKNGKLKIGYTIEFFPEEGKYHWSGHRACNIRYNPLEVKEKGEMCPVCKKPLTIGVENRVLDLSEKFIKKEDLIFLKNKSDLTFVYDKEKKRKPFVSLIPLMEILTEINNGSPTKAQAQYETLTATLGTEFDILMKKSYEEIEKAVGPDLKQAIEIVRNRQVFVDPGYDGVFGVVKIFNNNEKKENTTQTTEKQEQLF